MLEDAAAFVDRVGIALVFPKDDIVLPSLWTAAGGEDEFSERDAAGNFLRWTPAMAFVWPTKDELPAQKLCAAGKHVRGRASLIALDVLPALVALAARFPQRTCEAPSAGGRPTASPRSKRRARGRATSKASPCG